MSLEVCDSKNEGSPLIVRQHPRPQGVTETFEDLNVSRSSCLLEFGDIVCPNQGLAAGVVRNTAEFGQRKSWILGHGLSITNDGLTYR